MKLSYFLEDSNKAWLHLERYVNNGSPSGFTKKYSPPDEFSPERAKFILVPILELEESRVIQVGKWPHKFANHTWKKNEVPLYPSMVSYIQEKSIINHLTVNQHAINTEPTASGRTLSISPKNEYHIKLHYPGILGRVDRALPFKKAVAGVENSLEIEKYIGKVDNKSFGFLPEIGLRSFITGDNLTSVSAVLRDTKPLPLVSNEIGLIPVFSLFAKDKKNENDKLMLVQLLEASSNPLEELIRIIKIILKAYKFMTFDLGLVPEINAQNILLSIDKQFKVKRAIIRDLGRVEKALHLRRTNGLSTVFLSENYKTYDFNEDADFAIKRHSFSLDFKLFKYVIEPIVDCGTIHLKIKTGGLDKPVHSLVSNILDIEKNSKLFPKSGTYFAHKKILLTGERPYTLFHGNRFR